MRTTFIQKTFAFGLILSLIAGMVLAFPLTASAGSYTKTYSGQFNEKWEKYVTDTIGGNTIRFTYGFNTFLINEDYVSSYYVGDEHYAKIVNGRGSYASSVVGAREYAEVEVTHNGSKVTYSDNWA